MLNIKILYHRDQIFRLKTVWETCRQLGKTAVTKFESLYTCSEKLYKLTRASAIQNLIRRKITPPTLFYFIYLFILFFRATLMAYGGSQSWGQIGATDVGLHHSTATRDLSCVCDLHHSLWQSPDP